MVLSFSVRIFINVAALPRGLPLRHFRLNNHPVGQENDEKHSFDWSFNRVRKTEKPLWYWPCPKFLGLNCADLHVVKTGYQVCRDFRRFSSYGLWRALFVSLENAFEFSAILSTISVSKQLNRRRREHRDYNKQETG